MRGMVMPARSRSKNGVASLAHVGDIHVLSAGLIKDVDGRSKSGHDGLNASYDIHPELD